MNNVVCRHCGLRGHSRTTSSSCLHYKGGGGVPATAPAVATVEQTVPGEAQEDYYKYDDILMTQEEPEEDLSVLLLQEDAGKREVRCSQHRPAKGSSLVVTCS
jgi:hypothetical protein